MKLHSSDLRVAAVTVLAPISWGTTYVTITELLPAGRPLLVAALRVLPAGLLLVAVGTVVSRWRPRGRDWTSIVVLAITNFAIFFPLLALAAYRLPGGVAASAGGLQPLLVLALTGLLDRARPERRGVFVGAVAAIGVALVVLGPGAVVDPVGVVAALAANLSFATGVVLTRRLPAPVSRIAATGWQLLLAAVLLVPLALVVEGRPPATHVGHLIGYAHLGLIGTGVAFVLWFRGIGRLAPVVPPLLGIAAPTTGALAGWILLDEVFSPAQSLGFGLALGAIAYGALRRRAGPVEDGLDRVALDRVAMDRVAMGRVAMVSSSCERTPGTSRRSIIAIGSPDVTGRQYGEAMAHRPRRRVLSRLCPGGPRLRR